MTTAMTLPEPTIDTPKGTRVSVVIHTGYVLHQDRPYECRSYGPLPRVDGGPQNYGYGCKCGTCDGVYTRVTGTYEGTTRWADNSIDGTVRLDEPFEGFRTETVYFKAPSGDLCF